MTPENVLPFYVGVSNFGNLPKKSLGPISNYPTPYPVYCVPSKYRAGAAPEKKPTSHPPQIPDQITAETRKTKVSMS